MCLTTWAFGIGFLRPHLLALISPLILLFRVDVVRALSSFFSAILQLDSVYSSPSHSVLHFHTRQYVLHLFILRFDFRLSFRFESFSESNSFVQNDSDRILTQINNYAFMFQVCASSDRIN